MAQTNQTQPTHQIKGRWYTIWREVDGDKIKLAAKYADWFDANIYTMQVVELDRDRLRVYTIWNLSEKKGERLVADVRLQPDAAAYWRGRIMSMVSIEDFRRIMWELDDIIKAKE